MALLQLSAREWRAIGLAPLAAPIGYAVGLFAFGIARAVAAGESGLFPSSPLPVVGIILAVGAPVAYGATLVAGLPAYVALRRAGHASRAWLWAVGGSIGAAVAAILRPSLRGDLLSIPFPIWAGVALGAVTAEVFVRLLGRSVERPPDAGAAS